jgi:hypothetical protein
MVIFRNRGSMSASLPSSASAGWEGQLDVDAYDRAREAAPSWDVYYLEREWREWLGENEIEPKHPTRHFVKFCLSWYEKRGRA